MLEVHVESMGYAVVKLVNSYIVCHQEELELCVAKLCSQYQVVWNVHQDKERHLLNQMN